VHASDEWFIQAGMPFPPAQYYEGFGQIENGVGMMRLLIDEVRDRLLDYENDPLATTKDARVSIVTGKLAYPAIMELTQEIMEHFPHIDVQVFAVENRFFGEKITVTGLLTGQDIIDQLRGQDLGDMLLLPCNVLKADEPLFLDDISLEDFSQSLQVPVNIIQSEGASLVDQIAACGTIYGGKDE
jgi:NifB/MoaA-like Fe-S oxidoreductase